jgi:hypothetical protein
VVWHASGARYQALQDALSLSHTEVNRQALELTIPEEVLNAINAVELSWQRIFSNRAACPRNAAAVHQKH